MSHVRRLSSLVFVVASMGTALAAPFLYRLVVEGAPTELRERLERAFGIWAAVPRIDVQPELRETANVQFAWGNGGVEFNPDLATRTVTTIEAGKATDTEVRINPDFAGSNPVARDNALMLEAGLRLGVKLEPGVSLTASERRAVSDAEANQLRQIFSVSGDLNGDGFVNIADLEIFAANFGKRSEGGVPLRGDFNADGAVDDRDLEIMKRAYSFEDPTPAPSDGSTAPTTPTPSVPAFPTTPTSPPAPNPAAPNTPPTPLNPNAPFPITPGPVGPS